jgi:replicative DNA helicase
LIYSDGDINFLLGILYNDAELCLDQKYPLDKNDFECVKLHQIVYSVIYNMAINGVKKADSVMVEEFLQNFPVQREVYEKNNGSQYIDTIISLSEDKISNIKYYWISARKHSLLRDYTIGGFDVSKVWDVDKSDVENEENLTNWSIEEIIIEFGSVQDKIKRKYSQEDEDTTRKKAGTDGKKILKRFKDSPIVGLSFESKYLTTFWNGCGKKQFFIRSGDTSSGKSRSIVGDLACLCVPEIYDLYDKKWIENPNGKNRGLYIGCEMELDEECDPLMWAYLSGVESSKIMKGMYTEADKKIIERAIDVINDDCMWMVDMPNFNIRRLEEEIAFHKKEFNIDFVGFDYILLNQALVREFTEGRGSGVGSRGDEVLLELSGALKDMCKKYDVGMISATQVNAGISDYRARDYQVLRGGKAIADKATGGSISMPITSQELNLVEPYITKYNAECGRGMGELVPNFVETVYKARFTEFPKECKIFSYYNLGNMRKTEMFVTNKDFMPVKVPKTVVVKKFI